MENTQNNLEKRLAEVQQDFIDTSIKYHNMKDRQSFKTLGITAGIALAAIGITLGHDWTMRIGFIAAAVALILAAIYGIKKVDQTQLQELETRVGSTHDQITSLKNAIKLHQMEQNKNGH
jgi:hypothetical protein